jgi:hypothetical protein
MVSESLAITSNKRDDNACNDIHPKINSNSPGAPPPLVDPKLNAMVSEALLILGSASSPDQSGGGS